MDAPHVELDQFTGRDLPDFAERRVRRGEDSELKIFSQRLLIEADRQPAVGNEGGNFGGKNNLAFARCEKQRAFPGAVARQNEAPVARVPHRDGERPDEFAHERFAEFEIQTGNHRHVRFPVYRPAPLRQPAAQLVMIVNLPVADRDDSVLLVHHRLVDVLVQTANGQPRRAQNRQLGVRPADGIRAAMRQGPEHRLHPETGGLGSSQAGKGDVAADATHIRDLPGPAVGRPNNRRPGVGRLRPGPRRWFPVCCGSTDGRSGKPGF